MINLGEEFLHLRSELVAEEQSWPINNISEIALRKEKRKEIKDRFASITKEIRLLRQRFKRLPALPDLACVRWAQSVLAYPNGRSLTVDPAFSTEDAGIVRLILLSFDWTVGFDRYVAPGCVLSRQTMRALGITTQDLHEAHSLPQIWPSLLDALVGKYIVSYDLQRIRQLLEKSAEQYELDPPTIIGDCLLQQGLRYFQAAGLVGLESLRELVGHPLPDPPDCTAIDRAYGQLHLLQAMAQGISGVSREVSILRERDDDMGDDLYDDLF